jgi:serine/threonine protein phosphatase 1
MSTYAIGDIHGCAKTLQVLLDTLDPTAEDHLIFIGDYIDRGPDSKGVIDLLLELRKRVPCTFLRGNHEAFMLDFLDRSEYLLWEMNGGMTTLDSYRNGEKYKIPDTHKDFVRETLLYHEEPEFFYVHAGLKAHLSIRDNLATVGQKVFLWERDHLDATDYAWEKPVVCGHTPQRKVILRDKLICIDTGCVFHRYPGFGTLAAIKLPDREVVEVRYVG